MSEEKKVDELNNVISIDVAKIKRMKTHGHLLSMLEEFEILKLKLFYDRLETKEEANRLVLLTKYFIANGPTENFRYSCQLLYDKYMKPYNL